MPAIQSMNRLDGRVLDGQMAKLKTWRAALANRHYAKTNVICMGASETEGWNGPPDFTQCWAAMLAKQLQADRLGGLGFIHPVPYFTTPSWWPCVTTGAHGPLYDYGPNHQCHWLGPDSGAGVGQMVWTVTGTSVDVIWISTPSSSGSFSWSVDGGTASTVSTSGSATNVYGKRTRINFAAAGTHTVTLTYVAGSGPPVYFEGIRVYNGDETTGITVDRVGANGWSTSQWIASAYGSSPQGWAQSVAALQPHLIILTQGVNDLVQGRTTAQFQADLATLITNIRDACTDPDPSILLIAYWTPTGHDTDWPPYIDVLRRTADADPAIGFLDLTQLFPSGTDTSLALTTDGTHPNQKGCAALADTVAGFLLGGQSYRVPQTPAQLKTSLALSKSDVGLANVDNTADVNKPVSAATTTALNGKAALTHTHTSADLTGASGQKVIGKLTGTSYTDLSLLAAATSGSIPYRRTSDGGFDVVEPSTSTMPTTKNYVDTALAARARMTLFAVLAADQTVTNSVTPVDTGLTVQVDATATYLVEAFLILNSSATADVALTWSAPSGATLPWVADGPPTTATAAITTVTRSVQSLASPYTVGGAGADTASMPVGTLTTAATAGALTFRFAQGTADASNTILKAGSWLRATRIS